MIKHTEKYLGVGFLVLAFVGLSFLVSAKEVVIEINESGFHPDTINIVPGTKVIFKNTGKQAHWPASNYHPTHTLYPEGGGCLGSKFDACQSLQPGEKYSFTFNKTGSWPAHDHIYPGLTMVINVGSNKPAATGNQDFKTLDYNVQTRMIKDMAKQDPAAAWQFLKSTFIVNGQVVSNAHEFAHMIGNEIYTQQGLDGIRICDNKFAFGCFHGVTEQLLIEQGPSVIREVQNKCLEIYEPQETIDYTGCIHGMGHGLFTFSGLKITKALASCDMLDEAYRNYCYDGVFMENSNISPDEVSLEKPWDFCESLDEPYHRNCARYVSPILMTKSGNVASTAVYCGRTQKEIFYSTCYENLGYEVSQISQGDPDQIKAECFSIQNKAGVKGCITGAAIETVFQEYSSWEEVSRKLCLLLEPNEESECIQKVNVTREIYKR